MSEPGALTIGIDASRAAIAQQTGTERYSARILGAMLAAGARHRFRLYLNAGQPLPLALRAGDRQRLLPFPRLWTHLRLSAELARHPVDALFVPAHVVPLYHPRASVVTIHDLGYRYEPQAHPAKARLTLDLTTRWSVRAAARVIAISGATRDDLVRAYGVSPAKITVVHHGVDAAFQPPRADDLARVRARYRLPERYLLSVGTLQPRKNVARLIGAFARLAAEDAELGLVLVGKAGWLEGEIEAALAASPARARIGRTGHVPDADLPALYGGAAAFALPSLYEGFGMPVLEAMACGAPVVVSDRGSLPEIAGAAAEIVDPLDVAAIARGIERALDPASRERRVAAGRRRAAEFTWERAGALTLAAIEQAAGERRK